MIKAAIEATSFAREILGLLLIAALVMATGAVTEADHASSPLATHAPRPVACHVHGGEPLLDSHLPHSRRPAPVSYQCCLTGHEAAVVQASYSPQPSFQCSCSIRLIESAPTACCLEGLEILMVLSADPPGTTPLRI
ncbi:MAG TPA: hypothetical protein VIX14_04570 [Terriglobales bacterium]